MSRDPSTDPLARAARERGHAFGRVLARATLAVIVVLLVGGPLAAGFALVNVLPAQVRSAALALGTAAVGICLGFVGMVLLAGRAARRRQRAGTARDEAIAAGVRALVTEYAAGSVLVLTPAGGSGAALRLALVGRKGGRRRVAFGFPDAEGREGRYDVVHLSLEAAGFPCWSTAYPAGAGVPRFLESVVSGERDAVASRAARLLREAADALEIGPGVRLRREVRGVLDPAHLRGLAADVQARTPGALGRWAARWFLRRADEAERALGARRPTAADAESGG